MSVNTRSSVGMRFWPVVMAALIASGCNLTDEPVPAGPIQTGPLPSEVMDELAPEATDAEPAQPTPTPSASATPSSTSEAIQSEGIVTGTVLNGTDDASIPAGLEIELRGVTVDEMGSISEFLSRTSEIDEDGSFRFEDVPFDVSASAYVVQVVYDGVEFADGAMVDASSPTLDLPLTIYENTTDPSVITIDAMHLILSQHPDALLVTEVMVLSNASDRVYVSPEPVAGGRRGSVLIPIPDDAYGLTFDEGELGGRFVTSGEQVYDTRQVFPGQGSHTVTTSYILPFSGPRQVSLPITYPTRAVTILAQEEIRISSPVLVDGGPQVIEAQAFHKYQARDLAAGQSLDMQVGSASGWVATLRIVLVGVICLLVAASVIYGFLTARRNREERDIAAEHLPESLNVEQQALLDQIKALDEALEAGKLNRFEWEAQRAELQAKLAEKME